MFYQKRVLLHSPVKKPSLQHVPSSTHYKSGKSLPIDVVRLIWRIKNPWPITESITDALLWHSSHFCPVAPKRYMWQTSPSCCGVIISTGRERSGAWSCSCWPSSARYLWSSATSTSMSSAWSTKSRPSPCRTGSLWCRRITPVPRCKHRITLATFESNKRELVCGMFKSSGVSQLKHTIFLCRLFGLHYGFYDQMAHSVTLH